MLSQVQTRSVVKFPEFRPERIYMMPFSNITDLPERWQPSVADMMKGFDIPREAYLMVDCKHLSVGDMHRRGGMHVDGNWRPEEGKHGQGTHIVSDAEFIPDVILVAGSHTGCWAYPGHYYGDIAPDGQVDEDYARKRLGRMPLFGGLCFAMDANTIHESIPAWGDYDRSFIRINIPQSKAH